MPMIYMVLVWLWRDARVEFACRLGQVQLAAAPWNHLNLSEFLAVSSSNINRHWLKTHSRELWAWIYGAVVLGLVLLIVLHVDGASRQLVRISGGGVVLPMMRLMLLSAAVLAMGVIPAFAGRWVLARRRRVRWLVVWLFGGSLVLAMLFLIALPGQVISAFVGSKGLHESGLVVKILGLAGLQLPIMAAVSMGTVWWDRLAGWGRCVAGRNLVQFLLPVGVCLAAGAILTFRGGGHIVELLETRQSLWPHLYIILCLLIFGCNAGGVARAAAVQGLDRFASLSIAVLPTMLASILVYVLFLMGTAPDHVQGQVPVITTQLIRVGDAGDYSILVLFLRWCIAYLMVVAIFGFGASLGLRMGPLPRRIPQFAHIQHQEFS